MWLQMDRLGANYMKTVGEIKTMLGAVPLVVNLPIGSEETFQGVFDLVAMKSIIWTGEVRSALAPLQFTKRAELCHLLGMGINSGSSKGTFAFRRIAQSFELQPCLGHGPCTLSQELGLSNDRGVRC